MERSTYLDLGKELVGIACRDHPNISARYQFVDISESEISEMSILGPISVENGGKIDKFQRESITRLDYDEGQILTMRHFQRLI